MGRGDPPVVGATRLRSPPLKHRDAAGGVPPVPGKMRERGEKNPQLVLRPSFKKPGDMSRGVRDGLKKVPAPTG